MDKKINYIPLDIPPFDDINVSKEEMIKCKNLFEEIAILMRSRCGIMEIHIAYHVISKIKEMVVENMRMNLEMIVEEQKRREEKLSEGD